MEIEVGGQIQGISLGSFLQIVHMDKTSCTLKIYSNDDVGFLYLQDGALIASETGSLQGLDAAYEILSWNKTVIIIDSAPAPEKNITTPLMSILMEGLRRKDEKNAEMESIDDARTEIDIDFDPETYVSKDDEIASQFVVNDDTDQTGPGAGGEIELDDDSITTPPVQDTTPVEKPETDSAAVGQQTETAERAVTPTEDVPVKSQESTEPPSESEADEFEFEGEDAVLPEKTVKGRIKKLAVVAVILVAATIAGLQFYRVSLLKKNYDTMISQIKSQPDLKRVKQSLQAFINSRDDGDRYLAKAVEVMNELDRLMKVDNKVKALSIDDAYKKTATDLYNDYRKKDRNKVFSGYVDKKMKEIPIKVEQYEFKKLGVLTGADREIRMKSYKSFLDAYPTSKNRQAVKNMIAAVGDEVYVELQRSLARCEKANSWDNCLELAKNFVTNFQEDTRVESVIEIRKELKEKIDYADLKFRASAVGFSQAREMYINYLKQNPETKLKKKIRYEVSLLNRKIDFQTKWDDTYAFCTNKAIPLSQRLREIRDYIERDYSGLFKKESSAMLNQLKAEEKELLVRKNRRQKELSEQKRLAKIQEEKDRIAREKEEARLRELKRKQQEKRLKEESARMQTLLGASGSRFKVNADRTVTDAQTGLTWTVIDSWIETGECMTYKNAKAYADKLRTGGYKDWRLPGTGELAVLYNRQPYYPSSGAQWYWTAETLDEAMMDGGKAAIFYPDKKDEFKKIFLKFSNCGYVHAVRP